MSLIIMVSPSSSLLELSDNDEGEHEHQDHPGDYSTRMDELFTDQSEGDEEGSPSQSPRSGGIEVTKATYREQLRDVLGSETTGEDDEDDDPDHPSSHGNAFSDDEHTPRPASDPQRPVSPSTPTEIHADTLDTLHTTDNSRRTRRCRVFRPTILSTIHHIFTRSFRLPPPCTPEYEGLVSPPDIIPTTFLLHSSTLTTKLRRYIQFTAIERTFTRIVTLLCTVE